ncbi:hypothetical protein BU24DRAFT_428135 [Aaosphaeria arxii CBS 175.79]|uniref:Uncharacterized protein n=1 Tax=Aaosphaeria arxii CBS 175.79 TaxID=1450172 RepID=A0A6A5XB08_9PLEO|nr:uncharacterized protein BU24DRAFT_428135 [Aaosphaeria arxii CBS 175.79]KAF2010100.1 hypothetical protein BU24DRAFT_428135 [Aaosphaeria arxii CBS 175.79]
MSQELTATHKQALTVLAREEEKRALSARQVIADMASSEFFRQNWDELLLAAPNCLELLGNINAISSTKLASTTPLKAPKGGFEHLKDYGNLKGGLSQLTNQGNVAFTDARIQMDKIHGLAGSIPGEMRTIVGALADPDVPMSVVLISLDTMKETATECYQSASTIQKSMRKWSDVCMELDDACSAESSSTEVKAQKAALNLQLAQDESDFRKEQETAVKTELDKMNTHLNDAKTNYQKAIDAMPTGMDLVGQQVLMSLGEAASGAITIGATAAATYVNPVGGVTSGVKTLTDEVRKFNHESSGPKPPPSDPKSTDKSTDSSEKGPDPEKASAKKSAILAKLTTTFIRRAKPKGEKTEEPAKDAEKETYYDLSGKFYADDSALIIAPAVKTATDELKAIIVGSPEGIRWDSVLPPKDETQGKISEVARLSHTLDRLLKDMKPKKGGLASQLMNAIVTEAIGVADELEKEAENAKDLSGWVKPDRKSQFFTDLDTRITRCASTALALDTVTKSTPGGVGAGNASLMAPSQTPEEKIASMNSKAAVAEQAVKSATTKLLSTQQTYAATLETYQKQTEQVLLVQDNLLRARQQVTALTSDKLTLETVRKVLIECISYLTDLKDRIGKLVIFFSGLTNLIDVCIKSQVQPFQKHLDSYAKNNQDKALMYGDFYRDLIFQLALKIAANFSLYRDVASMYMEVDRKCIQEGIILVGKLHIANGNDKVDDDDYFRENKKKLSEFVTQAEKNVKDIVQAKQKEIISGLQNRINEIGSSIAKFPTEFQPSAKAIEAVKDGAAITQSLTETEAAAPSAISTNIAKKPRKTVAW